MGSNMLQPFWRIWKPLELTAEHFRRQTSPGPMIGVDFNVCSVTWLNRSELTDPLRILRRSTYMEIKADFPKRQMNQMKERWFG
jgi:hypothetical protein